MFGSVVLVGLDRVFTEVFADTSYRLAPIDADEARAAIEELQAAQLLSGYRGRPAANRDVLAETVRVVGNIVVKHDDIKEIDVNLVLVGSDGTVALDRLISLTEAED